MLTDGSRMYNQTGNLYTGAFDCLLGTVKTEGMFALYKGFFAHLARILPHTVSIAMEYKYPSGKLLTAPCRFLRFHSQSRRTS